jgi:hypothetical protein
MQETIAAVENAEEQVAIVRRGKMPVYGCLRRRKRLKRNTRTPIPGYNFKASKSTYQWVGIHSRHYSMNGVTLIDTIPRGRQKYAV